MADEFVTMIKDGEEPIRVHPSVVDDHKRLGWQVQAEVITPTEEDVKTEKKKKKQEAEAIVAAKSG